MKKWLTLGIMTAFMSVNTAYADFSDAEKKELQSLFETFIKENPEMVREALINLAEREVTERRAAGLALVKNDEGDPVMGAGDEADITIYEFSDYNCGYCKRVFEDLQTVLADDDKVRLVLKEFPILAQSSLDAARAAVAAQRQGKFERFHIGMMEWRGAISMESIMDVARDADIDIDQLQADMETQEVNDIIERTRYTAQELEISGTPALIIGTEIVPGAVSADEIKKIIEREREKAGL